MFSAIDMATLPEKADIDEQYRCQTCSKTFLNIDGLYAHQNELGHLELKQTPRGPGYLCWKKGCNQYFKTAQALQVHFREIHAKRQPVTGAESQLYQFRCSQCSLAFKTSEKLQIHQHFHLIQAATSCMFCARSFRSVAAVRKHMESGHPEISDTEREESMSAINTSAIALSGLMKVSGMEKLFTSSANSPLSLSDTPTAIVNSVTSPIVSSIMSNGDKSSIEGAKTDMNFNEKVNDKEEEDMEEEDDMDVDEGLDLSNSMLNGDEHSFHGLDAEELVGKDQQLMEDYINSQAVAEGNYEDPTRRYKCHRCRLAFTKQNYLTGHNKTLLHRRGDKISYPMEKYMDPNRPYKCHVCKESFTQKNILLVHYNSVSHLHKLKQNGGPLSTSSTSTATTCTSPSGATSNGNPTHPEPSATPENLINKSTTEVPCSSLTGEATKTSISVSTKSTSSSSSNASSDGDKPYKCNICKTSYSQGTTLDIHIRSVAHQAKASKLQELVLTGQVDLNRPLIEQPNDKDITPQQHKKILNEILQTPFLGAGLAPQNFMFPGISSGIPVSNAGGLHQLPLIPGINHPLVTSGMNLSDTALLNSFAYSLAGGLEPKQKLSLKGDHEKILKPLRVKSEVDLADYELQAQQQSYLNSQSNTNSPNMQNQSQGSKQKSFFGRVKPQIQRNLLENIGFECVIHFNEYNMQRSRCEAVPEKKEDDDTTEQKMDVDNIETDAKDLKNMKTEEDVIEQKVEDAKKVDLPELNKSVCATCKKEFSSVWVLKAHREEVHRDLVPIGVIEDFGEQFRTDLEKKQPKEADTPQQSSPAISEVPSSVNVNSDKNPSSTDMPPPSVPPPPHPINQHMHDLQAAMMSPMFNLGLGMHVPFMMSPVMHQPMMFAPPMTSQEGAVPTSSQAASQSTESISQLHKQQQQHLAAQQAAMQNQKRARTRINDEQLKILRKNFDINNSPSEEQILVMSEQSGLPTKVIKHWFRNTLFKERQRNKDSPYNFNNAPTTTLDLEEYEKTGKLPMVEGGAAKSDDATLPSSSMTVIKKEPVDEEELMDVKESTTIATATIEPAKASLAPSATSTPIPRPPASLLRPNPLLEQPAQKMVEVKSEPLASRREDQPGMFMPRSQSPDHNNDSFDSMSNVSSTPSLPITPNPSFQLPPMGSVNTSEIKPRFEHSSQYSKRANRTRFTDYQIKLLQEYFEQNAYPKDDELDHLSSILNLSPRVIVVWFQNARQKARKVYFILYREL